MAAVSFNPVFENAVVAKPLQGVWRSRGYGWIVRFEAAGPVLYHVAGEDCWRDPRSEADPDGVFKLWRQAGGGVVETAGDPDGTLYRFDRLKALPAACLANAPWTPQRTLSAVADTFAAYYPLSAERGLDWSVRRREAIAALGGSPTDADLWKALGVLLRGIDDAHVELDGVVDGQPRSRRFGEAKVLLQAQGRPGGEAAWGRVWRDDVLAAPFKARRVANGRIFWGREGEVGYLAVVTMGGFDAEAGDDDMVALDATLDEAMAAFADAKAVIVDVSNNRGGYDLVSRRIAGRFADARHVVGSKRPAGVMAVPQPLTIEPAPGPRYLGPVWLLTGPITVSAGETFVLMMRSLPNVRQVGTRTRGALSDQLPKPLPNGWAFALPAELYRDSSGAELEGRGLTPQMPLPVSASDAPGGGHAETLNRLLALIQGR
nr:S41 family peptidase [Caulobacter hibisci]